jgi:hypothetical protein
MSIALLITFCLSGQPDRCVERSDFDGTASVVECMIAGQQAGAQWVTDHPAYVMRSFRCRLGGGRERAA